MAWFAMGLWARCSTSFISASISSMPGNREFDRAEPRSIQKVWAVATRTRCSSATAGRLSQSRLSAGLIRRGFGLSGFAAGAHQLNGPIGVRLAARLREIA